MLIGNPRWLPPQVIVLKNVKFVEDHPMNIMYSLALIIFAVSEKKAFEHFPIGSNVKLPRNDHWKVLYKVSVFYADRKSKMAATAGHSINTEPYGENTEIYSSLKLR
jgi:hypothetical protein